jgi:4-hydroxy-tetrahydrodipicolinate reductase
MGQSLVGALREVDGDSANAGGSLQLTGAVAGAQSSRLGQDAALAGPTTGVRVTSDPQQALAAAQVALDFSLAQCVPANAAACVAARIPVLVGVTGFDASVRAALVDAAATIPVLIAPNTSVGVNVMLELVRAATRALGSGYDAEISEAHHRFKRDAPSGTALALGEAVASARNLRLEDVAVYQRHGIGSRRAGSVGFSVLRAGDIVGEHTVTFAIGGERLEITHRATDRLTFARGALRAAAWLAVQPKGLYAMSDVLGLQDQP